jgi:Zn-dependent protease
MALVAAAGPVSNFVVAFLGLLAFGLLRPHLDTPFFAIPVLGVLNYVYWFNLGLGIFNLIPLPPLDGGHFLPYLFPRGSWTLLRQIEQYGPMILILLVMSGATRHIMGPPFTLMNTFFIWLVRTIV